ncbi:MAG TPA: methyltransferase domain-containing protein [Candidatus Binataceae bacterium]|nr:methyltransferase domain-containing protein [Candidatus Binataceae bacterium]
MEQSRVYTEQFFDAQPETAKSAGIIAGIVCEKFAPRRVVDVGCGLGLWLAAFHTCGVPFDSLLGLDGDYVPRAKLAIPESCFAEADLESRSDTSIAGTYDLAICLEVAEHLRKSAGDNLVRRLTTIAPLVMFSAAVPGQPGTRHVNLQWPTYWRARFEAAGFRMFDPIRPTIRGNENVLWWYQQNIFLFARADAAVEYPALGNEVQPGNEMEWVHAKVAIGEPLTMRKVLRSVPGMRSAWRRLKPLLHS